MSMAMAIRMSVCFVLFTRGEASVSIKEQLVLDSQFDVSTVKRESKDRLKFAGSREIG